MKIVGTEPRYVIRLSDVRQLARLASLADDLKNYIPLGCAIVGEAADMVARSHNTLQRVLGADAARVYGPAEREEGDCA